MAVSSSAPPVILPTSSGFREFTHRSGERVLLRRDAVMAVVRLEGGGTHVVLSSGEGMVMFLAEKYEVVRDWVVG
jgi:hypothetical protein